MLFEIGCEEIPAGMIAKAAQELKGILAKHLTANGLLSETSSENSVEAFGAPRRLVAIARNVRLRQEDVTREIIGPPKSVAFDNVGEPTRAAMSFAEKQGVPVSELIFVNTPRGECLATKQVVIGQPRRANSREDFAGSDSRNFLAAVDVLDRRAWASIYPTDSLDRGGARWEGLSRFFRGRCAQGIAREGIGFSARKTSR